MCGGLKKICWKTLRKLLCYVYEEEDGLERLKSEIKVTYGLIFWSTLFPAQTLPPGKQWAAANNFRGHIQQRSLKIREKSGRKSLRCRSLTLFFSRRNSVSNGQREWLIRQLSSNAHFRLLELSKNDEYLAQCPMTPRKHGEMCLLVSRKKERLVESGNVSGLDFERWLCDTPH